MFCVLNQRYVLRVYNCNPSQPGEDSSHGFDNKAISLFVWEEVRSSAVSSVKVWIVALVKNEQKSGAPEEIGVFALIYQFP